MTDAVEILRLSGDAVGEVLEEIAKLRIEVFREFPYLYAGDAEAEARYLESFSQARGSVVVVARGGGEVVGVSTGLPLAEADEVFREPFECAGERVDEWFYFGESVIRTTFRGRGIGGRFFDEREAHARRLGFQKTTFCGVDRQDDHSLRPASYRTLDAFWSRRGYEKRDDLVARLGWVQVDSNGAEVINTLTFRTKA